MSPFQSPPRGRDTGVLDALQSVLWEPVVVLFALVTQLGNPWFLIAVGSGLYLAGAPAVPDRRRAAFVLALALGVVALAGVLKGYFALPRPPVRAPLPGIGVVPKVFHPLYLDVVIADGFAFPSGHALGTAAVWGGIALVSRVSTLTRRLLAAALVTGLVALSRLVLGVHYLADVLAGTVAGAAFLLVVYRLAARGERPERAFAIAVGLAVLSAVVGDATVRTAATLGATASGLVVWRVVSDRVVGRRLTPRKWAVGAALGTLVVGSVGYAYLRSPVVAFLGGALAVAGVLATPLLADEPDSSDPETGFDGW